MKKKESEIMKSPEIKLYRFDVLTNLHGVYVETKRIKKKYKEARGEMTPKSKENSLEELLRALLIGNLKDIFSIFSRPV